MIACEGCTSGAPGCPVHSVNPDAPPIPSGQILALQGVIAEQAGKIAALEQQIELMTEPGKASGIVRGVFEVAERECGHHWTSARHGLSTIAEWIAEAKRTKAEQAAEIARLTGLLRDLKATHPEWCRETWRDKCKCGLAQVKAEGEREL